MLSHEDGAHSERSLGSLGEAVVSLMKRVEEEGEGESLKKNKKKRDGLSESKKMSGILFRLQDSAYESDQNTDSHSGIFTMKNPLDYLQTIHVAYLYIFQFQSDSSVCLWIWLIPIELRHPLRGVLDETGAAPSQILLATLFHPSHLSSNDKNPTLSIFTDSNGSVCFPCSNFLNPFLFCLLSYSFTTDIRVNPTRIS
jgi:hypothetical protein